MKKVEHSLRFVTEFDETHPVAQRFLSLDLFSLVISSTLHTLDSNILRRRL